MSVVADRTRFRARSFLVPACLLAGLFVAMVVSAMVGPELIGPDRVLDIVHRRIWGTEFLSRPDLLIAELRFPRAVVAALVGAMLALVGAVLQAIVRNPLADPSILGGTSGATLGAVVAIVSVGTGGLLGSVGIAAAAFVGAGAGFGISLALSVSSGGLDPLRLVLAGIAVSFMLGALASVLVLSAGNERRLRSVVFWQMGSVAGVQWSAVPLLLIGLATGAVYLLIRGRRLDILALGDDSAYSMGISPTALRLELMVVSAVLTGLCVAAAGGIGFVALVIPHVIRMLIGPLHRRMLPATVLAGGLFLVAADVVARVVAPPADIPIGVVTALVGAPALGYLVRQQARRRTA